MNIVYAELPQVLKQRGGLPDTYQYQKDGSIRGLLFPSGEQLNRWGLNQCVGIEVVIEHGQVTAFWGF